MASLQSDGDRLLATGGFDPASGITFFDVRLDPIGVYSGVNSSLDLQPEFDPLAFSVVDGSGLTNVGLDLQVFGQMGVQLTQVVGSAFRDRIDLVQNGAVTVETGAGRDQIRTSFDGGDVIFAGADNDYVRLRSAADRIEGGSGIDTIELSEDFGSFSVRYVGFETYELTTNYAGAQTTLLKGVENLRVLGEDVALSSFIPDLSGLLEDRPEVNETLEDLKEQMPDLDLEFIGERDIRNFAPDADEMYFKDFDLPAAEPEMLSAPFQPTIPNLSQPKGGGDVEPVVKGQGDLDERFQHPDDGGPNWAYEFDWM